MARRLETTQLGFYQRSSLRWADNHWILSQAKEHLKQKTCPCQRREEEDMVIKTKAGQLKLPFVDKFKIQGKMLNREGRMQAWRRGCKVPRKPGGGT